MMIYFVKYLFRNTQKTSGPERSGLKRSGNEKSCFERYTAAKSPEYKRYGVLNVRLQNVRILFVKFNSKIYTFLAYVFCVKIFIES